MLPVWRLLDPSFILLAVLATWMLASLLRYLLAERDGRKLRTAFAHYLSPALVAELARDPGRLRLGGELREMSFLFTDPEGFTRLTESFGAPALVGLLNAYLDGLCDIAFAAGGTLDKIVGDAVHVMFNAPLDQPDHAARAVRCADGWMPSARRAALRLHGAWRCDQHRRTAGGGEQGAG
jgi:adenylate cyclase